MEKAIEYEYIIRRAYKVGRLEIPAAHADTFRGLELSFINQRDNKDIQKNDELKFYYSFNCGEVSTNLKNAIWQFEKDNEGNLSEEDKENISTIESLLLKAKIDEIDKSMDLIKILFSRHGIII